MDQTKIKEIAQKRAEVDAKTEELLELEKVIRELPEKKAYASLLLDRESMEHDLSDLEEDYRKVCDKSFMKTGTKKFHGANLAEVPKYTYDEDFAVRYAIDNHDESLLKIKRGAFNKIAKGEDAPDFVIVVNTRTVRLDKDLSRFLDE